MELLVRGAAKISSFKFQYLHPPSLVILNELSLTIINQLVSTNHHLISISAQFNLYQF